MNQDTKPCFRHRMVMLTSEQVYATKYCYGDPIKQVVTFGCLCCGARSVTEYKHEPAEK
jgi:hypothetical protein